MYDDFFVVNKFLIRFSFIFIIPFILYSQKSSKKSPKDSRRRHTFAKALFRVTPRWSPSVLLLFPFVVLDHPFVAKKVLFVVAKKKKKRLHTIRKDVVVFDDRAFGLGLWIHRESVAHRARV